MKLMKGRHSHKNQLAWKSEAEEVRYFLSAKKSEGSPSIIEIKNGRFKKIIEDGGKLNYAYTEDWKLEDFDGYGSLFIS